MSRGWHLSVDSSIDSTIDSTITLPDAACASAPALTDTSIPGHAPALPGAAAEPAASFVQPSLALYAAVAQAYSLPDFRIAAELPASLVLHRSPAPAAAAEPAASFVQPSAALFVQVSQASGLTDFRIAAELPASLVLHQSPAPTAEAEPAASFVQPSVAQQLAAVAENRQTGWPAFSEFTGFRHALSLESAPAQSGPAAEPAASFVQPSLAQPVPAMAPALRMTAFVIAADLEPSAMIDELIESTHACEVFWTAPAAEAASSFVRSSVAPAFSTPIAPAFPQAAGAIATPYVPVVVKWLAPQGAEPAMAAVWPHAAASAIALIRSAADWHTPAVPDFIQCQSLDIASAIGGLATAALESPLACSTASVPMPAAAREVTKQAVAALALSTHVPTLAVALASTGPLGAGAPEPVAVESLLFPASAALISRATTVEPLPFQLAASTKRIVPSSDGVLPILNAAEPEPASAKVIAMPISTLTVAKPQPGAQRPLPSIPQAGLLALEYHSHRLRSAPVGRVEWRNGRPALFPPRLTLRPVFEKHEQVVWQKPVRKEPAFAEVFTLPGARRPVNSFLRRAGMAIAASLLVGAVLWLGAGAARLGSKAVIARADAGAAEYHANRGRPLRQERAQRPRGLDARRHL